MPASPPPASTNARFSVTGIQFASATHKVFTRGYHSCHRTPWHARADEIPAGGSGGYAEVGPAPRGDRDARNSGGGHRGRRAHIVIQRDQTGRFHADADSRKPSAAK